MRLDIFRPFVGILPEVKMPSRTPTLNEKLMWTSLVLLLYFIMYHIIPFGAKPSENKLLEFLQVVLASKTGTLLTIGIGPIILASIFLQLFAGAKIIEVDFTKPEDKKLFSTAQKIITIILACIESIIFVYPGFTSANGYIHPDSALLAAIPLPVLFVVVTLQIAFASIILMFLDELTSRYGIGSGISLFIAAGISLAVIQGTIMIIAGGEEMQGYPTIASILANPSALSIPQMLMALLPLIFSFIIIVVSIYADNVKVLIPIAFDKVRGFGSSFPVKLLYVSVLPVILTSALLSYVNMLSYSVFAGVHCSTTEVTWVHYIGCVSPSGSFQDGLLYFLSSFPNPLFVSGGYPTYLELLGESTPLFHIPQVVHIIIRAIVYVLLCVFFGKFWVDVAGMSAADIANQLTKTGLAVPGFRRDPRIIQTILDKYINTIVFIGSIFVGLLAVIADLTGALGTGTGILLTTGIISKLYEDYKKQKMAEGMPGLGSIFGI
jgi:preprotein translocase subunit SecY